MSINNKMQTIKVQENKSIRSKSGATKNVWEDSFNIDVAIYNTDNTLNTTNAMYISSSHIGLTQSGLKQGRNRLVDSNGDIYNIKSVIPGRLNTLFLEKIENV